MTEEECRELELDYQCDGCGGNGHLFMRMKTKEIICSNCLAEDKSKLTQSEQRDVLLTMESIMNQPVVDRVKYSMEHDFPVPVKSLIRRGIPVPTR